MAKSKRYPPPREGHIFVKRWELLIDHVTKLPGFSVNHLFLLEELCTMYEEADYLAKMVDMEGYSRADKKPTVHAEQLNRRRAAILQYSKEMGLLKAKRVEKGSQHDEERDPDSWE